MINPSKIIISITNVVFTLAETLIGLRIILKIFGASTSAQFVSWLYATTEPLLKPFSGMFPSPKIDGFFTLEFSALFALIVYAFVGYFIIEIVNELSAYTERRN